MTRGSSIRPFVPYGLAAIGIDTTSAAPAGSISKPYETVAPVS